MAVNEGPVDDQKRMTKPMRKEIDSIGMNEKLSSMQEQSGAGGGCRHGYQRLQYLGNAATVLLISNRSAIVYKSTNQYSILKIYSVCTASVQMLFYKLRERFFWTKDQFDVRLQDDCSGAISMPIYVVENVMLVSKSVVCRGDFPLVSSAFSCMEHLVGL
jgi:hypothetical protein